MAYTNRQPTLKRTYYRSFLLLVVIPLVLVFVCAEIVVSYIIRNSAIETIDAFQENIATTISGDVRDNALQLSHFVYTNDGEFIQTAVTVHRSRGSDWYIADQAMQRAFRTAMVPSQDILVGAFYMDRAGAVYMKDDVAIPEGQVREAGWYRQALEQPNRVVLSCYDTSRTRVIRTSQQNRQMVLVTAMATDAATDRTGAVEVVSFFTVSQAGDILDSQRRDRGPGRSVILDRDGHVLFGDMGDDGLRSYFENRLGRFTPGSLMRIRYSNSFEVSYDVQSDCLDYMLPRLTLQPILENSITHGFEELTEELGRIEVSVYQKDAFLCLSVWDNGRGMKRDEIALVLKGRPREKNDNTSIGLENVQARLRLNFGPEAGLEMESEPGRYTRATLRLPLAACTKKEEERNDPDPDRR